jgi:hypothetical protein
MTSGLPRACLGVVLAFVAVLPAGGGAPAAPEAATLNPEQILGKAIDSPMTTGRLEDALSACERQARQFGRLLLIVDWAEIAKIGVTRDSQVTVKEEKATVQQFIELILRAASPQNRPLGWYRLETTVFITTQDYILRNKSRLGQLAGSGEPKAQPGGEKEARRSKGPSMPGGFNETPLETVIEYFREMTDLNFHVNWKALEAIGVTRNTPVSMQVRHIGADRALDLVVDQLTTGEDRLRKVYWYVEDGIVCLSSGQALNNTPLTAETYALGGLMMDVPDFIGPRLDISKLGQNRQNSSNTGLFEDTTKGAGAGEGETDISNDKAQSRAARRKQLQETIINVIKSSVGNDMWEPDGKGRITILRDKVIVSQTKLGWILMGRAADKR